jgi:hypothetical protein
MPSTTTSAVTAREKLHDFIEQIEDKKILALYALFGNEIDDENFEDYPQEWKNELDKRRKSYKNGESVLLSPQESKRRIQKLLKR